jgi:hypothetical protein
MKINRAAGQHSGPAANVPRETSVDLGVGTTTIFPRTVTDLGTEHQPPGFHRPTLVGELVRQRVPCQKGTVSEPDIGCLSARKPGRPIEIPFREQRVPWWDARQL